MSGDLVRVPPKGQVTLPAVTRQAAHIEVGAVLEVSAERGAVILRPSSSSTRPTPWYWTAEWQAAGGRARSRVARARWGELYLTDDEFLSSL